MQILRRDEEIIRLVGQFKQLKTSHIRRLLFHDRSRVPLDRALARLLAGRYLRSLGRCRSPDAGGSGARVYQLGSNGWRIAGAKKHTYLKIHDHHLAIADAYVALTEAQRAGLLSFTCQLEVSVPGGTCRADMLLSVAQPGQPEPVAYYVEVEVCFKSDQLIRDKLAAYVRAWDASTGGFPYVVIVAPDEDREFVIASLVGELGEDGALFKVCVGEGLVGVIMAT